MEPDKSREQRGYEMRDQEGYSARETQGYSIRDEEGYNFEMEMGYNLEEALGDNNNNSPVQYNYDWGEEDDKYKKTDEGGEYNLQPELEEYKDEEEDNFIRPEDEDVYDGGRANQAEYDKTNFNTDDSIYKDNQLGSPGNTNQDNFDVEVEKSDNDDDRGTPPSSPRTAMSRSPARTPRSSSVTRTPRSRSRSSTKTM